MENSAPDQGPQSHRNSVAIAENSHRPRDRPSTRAGSPPCRSSTDFLAGSASPRRSATGSRVRTVAGVSPTPRYCSCSPGTCSSHASPSTASASGPRGTNPRCLGSPRAPTRGDQRRRRPRSTGSSTPTSPTWSLTSPLGRFGANSTSILTSCTTTSTTVTFHGDYSSPRNAPSAASSSRHHLGPQHGPPTRPETTALYPHCGRRQRPCPMQFRVEWQHHRRPLCTARPGTLRKLTGRADFSYVADCKLATGENMAYLHNNGGRFVTVLPRTRRRRLPPSARSRPASSGVRFTRSVRSRSDRRYVLNHRDHNANRRGLPDDLVTTARSRPNVTRRLV